MTMEIKDDKAIGTNLLISYMFNTTFIDCSKYLYNNVASTYLMKQSSPSNTLRTLSPEQTKTRSF